MPFRTGGVVLTGPWVRKRRGPYSSWDSEEEAEKLAGRYNKDGSSKRKRESARKLVDLVKLLTTLDDPGCPRPSTIEERVDALVEVDGQEEHTEIIADARRAMDASADLRRGGEQAEEAKEFLAELAEHYSEVYQEVRKQLWG